MKLATRSISTRPGVQERHVHHVGDSEAIPVARPIGRRFQVNQRSANAAPSISAWASIAPLLESETMHPALSPFVAGNYAIDNAGVSMKSLTLNAQDHARTKVQSWRVKFHWPRDNKKAS